MIKSVVADLILGLGILGALATLFDWYLGADQKKRLEAALYRWWYWLAEHKSLRILRFLKNSNVQDAMYGIHACASCYFQVRLYIQSSPVDVDGSLMFSLVFGALGGLGIYRWIAKWLCRAESLAGYFARTAIVILPLALVAGAAWVLGEAQGWLLIVFFVSILPLGVLVDVVVLSLALILLMSILQILLRMMEITLRRMLEQGRGALVGLSVLLGAIGLLLKSLL